MVAACTDGPRQADEGESEHVTVPDLPRDGDGLLVQWAGRRGVAQAPKPSRKLGQGEGEAPPIADLAGKRRALLYQGPHPWRVGKLALAPRFRGPLPDQG